jgi:hypothetical protein
VWEWILADPEAKAWLDGQPDEFGMKVNPVYATTAGGNTNGVPFAEPVPETFPKSDPHCYQAPPQGPNGSIVPPALCGTDWMPFTTSYTATARQVRAADDGARISGPDLAATSQASVWKKDGPQPPGRRAIMGMVDTPHSTVFGLQSAHLSRAGDGGSDRKFIAPTEASLTAGVNAMQPGRVAKFLEPDPLADAPDAYPLTTLTYAATTPLALEAPARAEYAAFLGYGTTDGQVPGLEVGQLPPGYAPLPPALQAQAKEAVKAITDLKSAVDEEPTGEDPGDDGGSGDDVALPSSSESSDASTPFRSASSPLVAVELTTPTSLPGESEPSEPVGPLLKTAFVALAGNRFVLPGLVVIALLSALAATEITRRPGMAQPTPPGGAPSTEGEP